MTGTMALTGLFPIGEYVRDYDPKTKTYTRRQLKKYNKIREIIIAKTLDLMEEDILNIKKQLDETKHLSDTERIKFLAQNARAAQNAKKNANKNILVGLLGLSLNLLSEIPGLNIVIKTPKHVFDYWKSVRDIRQGLKAKSGLFSDAILKSDDSSKAFDPYWERYILVKEEMEKHKDDLIEKQKTLSKEDFQEYLDQYTQHVIEIVDEKKKQQEMQDQQTETKPETENNKLNNQNQPHEKQQYGQENALEK